MSDNLTADSHEGRGTANQRWTGPVSARAYSCTGSRHHDGHRCPSENAHPPTLHPDQPLMEKQTRLSVSTLDLDSARILRTHTPSSPETLTPPLTTYRAAHRRPGNGGARTPGSSACHTRCRIAIRLPRADLPPCLHSAARVPRGKSASRPCVALLELSFFLGHLRNLAPLARGRVHNSQRVACLLPTGQSARPSVWRRTSRSPARGRSSGGAGIPRPPAPAHLHVLDHRGSTVSQQAEACWRRSHSETSLAAHQRSVPLSASSSECPCCRQVQGYLPALVPQPPPSRRQHETLHQALRPLDQCHRAMQAILPPTAAWGCWSHRDASLDWSTHAALSECTFPF